MSIFDRPADRTHTDSMKWDIKKGELPMWVADMDFETCPAVKQAVENRGANGAYGYTLVPDAWYSAYTDWWKNRHDFELHKEWLMFCTGIVPAISSVVRRMTHPNENVVLLSPVYNIFYNSIRNNGARILESELLYEDGKYSINWTDLEACLKDEQTTLMIFCNPHNPVGKIWNREELERLADLACENHVVVLSDEIHCDLTEPGREYIPFASVSEKARQNSITCISPSKAFNLAGLQSSCISVPNPVLRHQVSRGINNEELAEPNCFACISTIAAFSSEGADWLDDLVSYVFENRKLANAFIRENIPELTPVEASATYLLWIDCSKITDNADGLQAFLREETGLYVSEGSEYGTGGKAFLRMNLATSRERVKDGLSRLKTGVELWKKNLRSSKADV